MPVFEVSLQVFASGSDVITVDAADRDEAERLARQRAIHDVDTLKLRTPIEEIIINSIEEVGAKSLARFNSTRLKKDQLLMALEHVPQHFWPPRPTQQRVETLRDAIREAIKSGRYEFRLEHVRA